MIRVIGKKAVLSQLEIVVFSLFCLLLSAVGAQGQTALSTLRGTVTDATGSVVAGAQVNLLEPATGQIVRQAKSTADGNFEFAALKPGTYELTCDMTGFKSFVAQGILLESGQIRRVDAMLAVGAAVEKVTVTEGAAVISTESPTLSGTFSSKQNDTAPLVNIYPTPYSLLTTLSGVQGGGGVYPVVNGQQQGQQSQSFDGIPNDLTGEQSNNSNFFEEVSAITFNAPAESSQPVEINEVSKRGSNTIHGVASYKLYDSVLNARQYFSDIKTPYLQHEWDLEAGGPIIKDKTFFYGQWFAQRIPLGTPEIASVPTLAWRQGQFSSTIIDPQTGQPFANNTIPASRMSSVAQAFQNKYYPTPTNTNIGPVNNYFFTFPFNSDLYRGDWLSGRVDHNLTQKNSVFARWLMRRTPYVLSLGLPDLLWTRLRRHQQWAAGDTHVFSPQLLNTFKFGVAFDYIVDGQTEAGRTPANGADVLTETGLQGSNPSGLTGEGFPEIDISGLNSLYGVAGGVKADNRIVTVSDSVDWQVGRHVWKFGFNTQRYKIYTGTNPNYGTFNFNGSLTAPASGATADNAYADFLLGLPQQSQRSNPLVNRSMNVSELGFYAEDTFKVNQKLTLNYGARWDYYGAPSASDHLMYNWDPISNTVLIDPKAISKVSPLYPVYSSTTNPMGIKVASGDVKPIPAKSNLVPRLGAAYRFTDHFVIRGGYGIYISRITGSYGDVNSSGFANNPTLNYFSLINPQLGSTGPFSITETYLNTVTKGQPLLQFPNPYPSSTSLATVPSQSVVGYPRHVDNGHIHQFSASVERELAGFGLRASYVGSRSTGQNYQININKPQPSTTPFVASARPYQPFVKTTYMRYDGSAKYDGLQLEVKRRAGNVLLDASYTLARSLANYLDTENPYDVLSHWANDGPTRRHYASISATWALPFGKGQRYLSNASAPIQQVAGNWSLNSITYLGSGFWFSPEYSGSDSSNTGTFGSLPDGVGNLPDRVGNPNSVPGGRSKQQWFNTAAFAVPQEGHFGNALPFSLENQALYVTHLGVVKVIPITERLKFHFTGEISNLFNHAEFLPPSGNISTAGGAQFTSQVDVFSSLERAGPRQITFQGAFRF